MSEDSLGDRMKGYENVPRHHLIRRTPVVLRLDGKAFHTLTRGMDKPFDGRLTSCMWGAATEVCKQVQGAQFAYVQSDEISVLVTDYATLSTDAWFDYGVQKMVSVAASFCTAAFLGSFRELFPDRGHQLPVFDCRAFNLPREEVNNYFVWRQQDAVRNSIQMLGRAHFSHKELHLVNCKQIQDKLFLEKGINWNALPGHQKRGGVIARQDVPVQPVPAVLKPCDMKNTFAAPAVRKAWLPVQDPPDFHKDPLWVAAYVNPTDEEK